MRGIETWNRYRLMAEVTGLRSQLIQAAREVKDTTRERDEHQAAAASARVDRDAWRREALALRAQLAALGPSGVDSKPAPMPSSAPPPPQRVLDRLAAKEAERTRLREAARWE
jgi:hypothetical protein